MIDPRSILRLSFFNCQRTQSSLNTFFVISYLSSAEQMIIIVKKGHTFRPSHGSTRALDYSSLILDLMYKTIGELFISWLFVSAWIHLKRCLLQFLICDCSDSNIKKLNYHFHIKFTPVKGTYVDLISL